MMRTLIIRNRKGISCRVDVELRPQTLYTSGSRLKTSFFLWLIRTNRGAGSIPGSDRVPVPTNSATFSLQLGLATRHRPSLRRYRTVQLLIPAMKRQDLHPVLRTDIVECPMPSGKVSSCS
jgi:hypothetical protein